MATNTLIHDRKMRKNKQAEQDQQDTIKRANDYAKRRGIVAGGSPVRQIDVLSQYLGGLERIRDEMLEDFGYLEGIKAVIKRIDAEIGQVLKEIALSKMQAIKPSQ